MEQEKSNLPMDTLNRQESPRNVSGVIYTFTIVRVGFGHMAEKTPYGLLMVLSDDKGKMEMGALFTKDVDSIAIGQRVKLLEADPEIGYIFSLEN